MRIPMETKGAPFWDAWWTKRLSESGTSDRFPRAYQAPLVRPPGNLNYLWVDNDDLLATVMAEYGLRTVLCAGNGVSQEPRSLAAAGFNVTALDISPVAVSCAETCPDDSHARSFCSPEIHRPGGRARFVVGDLLDRTVCPGPFDVIIERRTVQWFAEHERAAALAALSGRLSEVGIFLSLCLDDAFPLELGWSQHESGRFHASESWFREHGWTIWDGAQSSPLVGRVAWLVRIGTMKPRPSTGV